MKNEKLLELLVCIENNILNIIDNQDSLTRSDLQGAIEAQVKMAYQLGLDNPKPLNFEKKLIISKEII